MYVLFCLVCELTSQSSEQIGMVFITNTLSMEQIWMIFSSDHDMRRQVIPIDDIDL